MEVRLPFQHAYFPYSPPLPSNTQPASNPDSYSGQCGVARGGVHSNHAFSCGVSGPAKSVLRACVYVSPGAPDFEEELADCTAELGETVKLACRVTGTPKPIVSWYKGMTPGLRGAGPDTGKSYPEGIRMGGGQGPWVGPGQGLGVRDRPPAPGACFQIKDRLARVHEVGQRGGRASTLSEGLTV